MLIYKQETLLGASRNANIDKKLTVQSWKRQGVHRTKSSDSPGWKQDTEKNDSTSEIHCEFSLAAGKHISGTLLLISETDGALSRSQHGDQ